MIELAAILLSAVGLLLSLLLAIIASLAGWGGERGQRGADIQRLFEPEDRKQEDESDR